MNKFFLAVLLVASGCATSVPTTTGLSDAVLLGLKPNPAKTFSLVFESAVR